MLIDTLGGYHYTPGYCLRDALAQGLGAHHPLVQAVGRQGPDPDLQRRIRPLLVQHGLEHWISTQAWPPRSFGPPWTPIVWIIGRHSWGGTGGHAVFLRDRTPLITDADIIPAGYIILPDRDAS